MVKLFHRHFFLTALLCLAATISAQKIDITDTVTQYPHHGTFYHDRFEGRKTANGEIFDQNLFTAAHINLKMGTMLMVTNRNNGKQVIVRVNDRCPKRNVVDLTHRAAAAIGIRGSQPVNIRVLPPGYEERWKAQDKMFDSVYSKFLTEPKPSPRDPHPFDSLRYNIELMQVASHGEAFTTIQELPDEWQDDVMILSDNDAPPYSLVLDVRMPHWEAWETIRKLREDFPQCKIKAAE